MQEPNYSGFAGVAGSSPSPSPAAYPATAHQPDPAQPFLPPSLYPPSSTKAVLSSYMGGTGPGLLPSSSPPGSHWQAAAAPASSPATEPQPGPDTTHPHYSRLSGFGNTMGAARDTSNYFSSVGGMASHLSPYAAAYAAQNMMYWNNTNLASFNYSRHGVPFGESK